MHAGKKGRSTCTTCVYISFRFTFVDTILTINDLLTLYKNFYTYVRVNKLESAGQFSRSLFPERQKNIRAHHEHGIYAKKDPVLTAYTMISLLRLYRVPAPKHVNGLAHHPGQVSTKDCEASRL